jgi:hypothetical protein
MKRLTFVLKDKLLIQMCRYQFGNNKLLHNYLKLLLVKLELKNKKILLSNQIEMRFKDFVVF